MLRKMFLSVTVLVFSFSVVYAGQATFEKRVENQNKRIEKGVESGKIDETEAKRLYKQQQAVQNLENKATDDGKVTEAEKRRIIKAQNRASRQIKKAKRN